MSAIIIAIGADIVTCWHAFHFGSDTAAAAHSALANPPASMASMPKGPAWWVSGREGTLSPWSLAQVWALHAVSEMRHLDLEHTEIAEAVDKVGGGKPTAMAICHLRSLFEADREWYPGKGTVVGKRPGPKPTFTKRKKQCVARCAMAMARREEEVTVEAVQARCPVAAVNPKTGEVFDKKYILQVFRTLCHDGNPQSPWERYAAHQTTALLPELLPLREAWARKMLRSGRSVAWYFRHCIWFDPCSTVVPKGPRACFNMRQAGRGRGKHWMSEESRKDNKNLSASRQSGEQAGSSD